MSGKRPRPDDSSGSDSEPNLTSLDIPIDSDRPAAADLRSSPTTAPGTDLRPSSDHARTTDPRSPTGTARNTDPGLNSTSSVPTVEPFLHPGGSYVVIKPKDEGVSFRRINVFWPKKYLRTICGATDLEIETPANGSLIVRTQTRTQTKALLKCSSFCEKPVTVSLHPSRNSTKGTIFAPEMRFMSEVEILEGLKVEGVSHVRRLTTFRDGQRRDTSLLVLTFETTNLPDTVLAGYIRYSVRVFVPNPLRCFNCQKFGHSSKFCKQAARCPKCGEAPHEGSPCSAPVKCLSCDASDHTTNSTQCPVWKREKEICSVKVTSGVSYQQARRTVENSSSDPTKKTYAKAAQTQTATVETQTDPIPQLPPLTLLRPAATEPAVGTQTPALSAPGPSTEQTVRRPSADPPRPQATNRTGEWQTVRGRSKVKPAGTGQPVTPEPCPPPSTRGRPARPAVCVALGRSRSQSIGRYPPNGGNTNH